MDTLDKNNFLFTHLVLSLHTATMQQLGKIKNPFTDKVERDLNGAQGSIDMLEMIRDKTKGNLNSDESRMIGQVLQELRLNYVDEVNKPEPAPSKETDKAPETESK